MTNDALTKLIDDHWQYVRGVLAWYYLDNPMTLEIIGHNYRTAFAHGYKHAAEQQIAVDSQRNLLDNVGKLNSTRLAERGTELVAGGDSQANNAPTDTAISRGALTFEVNNMAELFNEKELEDYLYEISRKTDEESPIATSGKCFRQIEIGGYGKLDLLYVDVSGPEITVNIVELKKNDVDYNAVGQICRYYTAIDRYFKHNLPEAEVCLYGVLVGQKLNINSDVVYLIDQIEWLSVYEYSLSLSEGLQFEHTGSGWHSKKENFKNLTDITDELRIKYLRSLAKFKKFTAKPFDSRKVVNI